MRRRDFFAVLGGAAVAWPLAARAQQGERMRRLGVLISLAETDPESRAWVASLTRRLQDLGWMPDRNVNIDIRWEAGDADRARVHAAEIIALAPDVILADGSRAVAAVGRQNKIIPVVFVQIPDPVGAGIVPSLARPGGNLTGFTHYEYTTAGKWLEFLKEIAPRLERALVLARVSVQGDLAFAAVQAVARSLGMQVTVANVLNAADIERAVESASRQPDTGLLPLPTTVNSEHRGLIIALAARYRMPAAYPYRHFATGGGLLSYSIDTVHQFRQAADYVDRILKGEKPADLPVLAPSKYELVVNLKTAKTLGLVVPSSLLARADEVIE